MDLMPLLSDLHEGWVVEPLDGPVIPPEIRAAGRIAASVPGTVHTDLLAAGLIPDPLRGTNESTQTWIGRTSWRYSLEFEWCDDGAEHVDLAFDGLDTVATVSVNGVVLLGVRNQHRSYRVPVRSVLRDGRNLLQVDFAAPVAEADRASVELGYRPHTNHHPYNAIRKMACSFGWDWGPDTATSGIWRAVRLESWSGIRIAEVRLVPTVRDGHGILDAHVRVERDAGAGVAALTVAVGAGTASVTLDDRQTTATVQVDAGGVDLWWPVGYGEQPLSDAVVEARVDDGNADTARRRVGFRTVEVDLAQDEIGSAFGVRVNGRDIWVKGVNWIPDDPFPHRVDAARYRSRLQQALDANVNLIRVWGGGIYESDDFYAAADELGLLVWQDFLFACAAYSEEEPLASEVEAEARQAIVRLATHPSLVVLNGNNENLWGHDEWGWQPRLDGRTWGAGYYYELLPDLVAQLAPHVAYTPGSPFSPDPRDAPNDEHNGSMHIWDLWNSRDYPEYRTYRPRFVAEFGWQGPPTWSTLTEALDDTPLTPESPGMIVHQKANAGTVKLIDGLIAHLPLPESMPDWHFAMQLNQANAITLALEYFRSSAPHCQGAILWQLNDCWPAVSWAAVDGAGRPKPLLHAVRRAFAPRIVTVQPNGEGLAVAVVNDTDLEWSGELMVDRLDYDGTVLASARIPVTIPPRGVETVPMTDHVSQTEESAHELLRAELNGVRGLWFYAEYRESALAAPDITATAARTGAGVEVTVTAHALVRDLTVLADVADARAEAADQLITLLPGETVTIPIRTEVEDADRFLRPEVLRSANQLVAAAVVAPAYV